MRQGENTTLSKGKDFLIDEDCNGGESIDGENKSSEEMIRSLIEDPKGRASLLEHVDRKDLSEEKKEKAKQAITRMSEGLCILKELEEMKKRDESPEHQKLIKDIQDHSIVGSVAKEIGGGAMRKKNIEEARFRYTGVGLVCMLLSASSIGVGMGNIIREILQKKEVVSVPEERKGMLIRIMGNCCLIIVGLCLGAFVLVKRGFIEKVEKDKPNQKDAPQR